MAEPYPHPAADLDEYRFARANMHLATSAKAQHHAFATGNAVDQIAEHTAQATAGTAGGDGNFVVQGAVPTP